jgi:hypothetical protein
LIVNKELQDRLLEYLGSLDGAVRQAGGFVAEQAPLVAQEWIQYEFWSNVISCVALIVPGLVLLTAALLFLRRQFRDLDYPWFLGTLVGLAISIPLLCVGIDCGIHALKAKIAPRVVVLEKIADMYQSVEG